MKKYIGLIQEEFFEENEWELDYPPTSKLEDVKKQKKEMLDCNGVEDYKIYEIKEIK